LFLGLEFVGTKELKTVGSLVSGKTLVSTLEKREDIFDDDCLEVNFFLIVQILRFKLNL